MKPSDVRPVPKPPGKSPRDLQLETRVQVAVNRDGRLNEQEQIAKRLALHECDPSKWPNPISKKKPKVEAPEEEQPISEEMFRGRINRAKRRFIKKLLGAGWKLDVRNASHRIRVEGMHESGAMVMLIIKVVTDREFAENQYVLSPAMNAVWTGVSTREMQEFLKDPHRQVKGSKMLTRCKCEKSGHPSRRIAVAALLRLKLKNVEQGKQGIKGHLYRCDDEDRRWHYTRQPENRYMKAKVKGLWKEPDQEEK